MKNLRIMKEKAEKDLSFVDYEALGMGRKCPANWETGGWFQGVCRDVTSF